MEQILCMNGGEPSQTSQRNLNIHTSPIRFTRDLATNFVTFDIIQTTITNTSNATDVTR